MIVNSSNLAGLTVGYKKNFQDAFAAAVTVHKRVATVVPSNTKEEAYPWLGAFPRMRKWVDARVLKSIKEHGYKIRNEKFELTVDVERDAIEDDTYGVYTPMFQALGQSVAEFPDELVFAQLLKGFTSNCYDGQYFFDTDHPVLDPVTRQPVSVSNMQAGASAPWFLLDTTRPLKPLILQERVKPDFVAQDDPKNPKVFDQDKFVYGSRARYGVGFGFWQMAFGSKAALTEANFNAGRLAMENFKNDEGVKLGIKPNLLVIGSSNEAAAEEILKKQNKVGGESNVNFNRVEILKAQWLD